MSELEILETTTPREYRANLYEIAVGEDSWVVLSNSYGKVAEYVDLVFRLRDLTALKIKRIELPFRVVMDMDIPLPTMSVMTPIYLAYMRDADTDTETRVLSNSIQALLNVVDEDDITSISLYSQRAVILRDALVGLDSDGGDNAREA